MLFFPNVFPFLNEHPLITILHALILAGGVGHPPSNPLRKLFTICGFISSTPTATNQTTLAKGVKLFTAIYRLLTLFELDPNTKRG